MTVWIDIYALCPARTRETLRTFLARFGPDALPAAAEYELPQYAATPELVTEDLEQLLDRLFERDREPYLLHWRPEPTGEILALIAQFTSDGELILGLSVRDHAAREMLDTLMRTLSASRGCLRLEAPPPDSASEFRALCAKP